MARGSAARGSGGAALQLSRREPERGRTRRHGRAKLEDARAALTWLRARYPELPFALAGFSFGSRVIMRLGCEIGGARWLVAAGFATRLGPADFLAGCHTPKIFIHSTHDEFGPRPDFERLYAKIAEPKRLVWIDAADHFFAGALEELEERVKEAAEAMIQP